MLSTRFRWWFAVALGLLAAGAQAQFEPDPKELIIGSQVHFAFGKENREELKLTDSQFQKMVDAFEGSLTVDGDRIMIMRDPSLDMEKCIKNAMAVLDEGQRKRLREIWIQELGGLAIGDDGIAKELKLADEQKQAVKKLFAETAKKLQDTFSQSPDESSHKAYMAIRKEAGEKAAALLTDEQKKALEALKGKPFKKEKKPDGG